MDPKEFKNRVMMPPPPEPEVETEEPEEIEHPNTPVLENMMMNQDEKMSETNNLLEHIIVNQDEKAEETNTLLEHNLVKTDEVVNELKNISNKLADESVVLNKKELADQEVFTIKGLKGDKGDNPTEEELLSLIEPLIPEPLKPSDEELVSLITPLIPEPIKGDKGDSIVGPMGPAGKDGLSITGPAGPRGPKGKDGKDGQDAVLDLDKLSDELNSKLDYNKIKNTPVFPSGGFNRLTEVHHDTTLSGTGTSDNPLKVVSSGSTTFLDLTDTPDSYTGQSGKVAVVNGTEDGLVFSTISGTDEKVKYDASDPTAGYIADKFAAGTGITIAEGTGATENKLKITNSAPDQTVAISAGTGISATGTYPNFTVTNTAPDQVVAITAGTNITSVTGTYPNFTINAATQGGSYTLPIASAIVLGGVKVGSGLSIDAGTGVLTATGASGLNYVSLPFTAQTTIVFTHNLGAYPIIQVIDDTGAVVIPVSITNTSVNSATVVFSSATTGTIMGTMGSSSFGLSEAVRSKSFTITNPTAGATYAIWKTPAGITIKSIDAVQIGGTNVVGILTECDADGLNPVVVDATDMTVTTSNTNKNSFTNPSIDSGDWIGWKNTSVSGAVSRLMVTFNYE